MPQSPVSHQVERCSVQISERGDGFVMDLANRTNEAIRLEFPDWIVHHLMRALPRIDAALQQRRGTAGGDLVAYPVLRWNVESAGPGLGLVLHLCDDRHVDAAFHLEPPTAAALQHALDDAMAGVPAGPIDRPGNASVN